MSSLNPTPKTHGDFYEPHPLAFMVERLAAALGVTLRGDWRNFVDLAPLGPLDPATYGTCRFCGSSPLLVKITEGNDREFRLLCPGCDKDPHG